jgi:two-component system phosphate regulon response regulator PhoB
LRHGGIEVDTARQTARVEGQDVALRPLELRLLVALMSRPGEVFGRRELISAVWGEYEAPIARTIDVHVRRLRERLGKAADRIETVHGAGYRFKAT